LHNYSGLNLPIFFITASPPQIEHKIYQKLRIDQVLPFGIFCKDNLENLHPQRLWRMTKHVGYKIQALLELRACLDDSVRLILFGDDGESDANIYSLFSDICARRINSSEIRRILNHFYVLDSQVDFILRLQELCPSNDPVEKIYINLAEDTDADYYLKFGRRTFPTYNALQTAVDLFQDQRLQIDHVLRVGRKLLDTYQYSTEELEKSLDELIRRNRLASETWEALNSPLQEAGLISKEHKPSVPAKAIQERMGTTVVNMEGSFDPWIVEQVDYLHEYR
jgi:hypothetical protein